MKIFYILWGLPQLLCYLYYCKRIPEIVEDLKSFTKSGGGVNSFLSQLPKREYPECILLSYAIRYSSVAEFNHA